MPSSIYVLDLSWTEPFLVLTFSFVMFCACRWPKALPYALGPVFLHQAVHDPDDPAIAPADRRPPPLENAGQHIVQSRPGRRRDQFAVSDLERPRIHPRRSSYFNSSKPSATTPSATWCFSTESFPPVHLPIWISLLPLVAIIPLSLRRLASSPAGFAAAVTAVHLFFFAFNKQAFCNYYYFVIATACWSIAAANFPPIIPPEKRGFEVIPIGSPAGS